MTNEQRIKRAANTMAKALVKLGKVDWEMTRRLSDAMAREMDEIRAGR